MLRKLVLNISLFLPLVLFYNHTEAQERLTYDEYIEQVRTHHPIFFLASLRDAEARALILERRGAFDPILHGNLNQKYFKDTEYYSKLNAGLKIPTWFGVTFQGGYDLNDGVYLSNESTVPPEGLWYAGITLNLGNGLFIDERRAELRQAELMSQATLQERRLIENQLLADASEAYWEWFTAYQKTVIYQQALTLANQRYGAMVQSAKLGDKAYIDTLKAAIQFQKISLKLEQSNLKFDNKAALLNVYLWQEGFIPLVLDSNTIPQEEITADTDVPELDLTILDTLSYNHPEYLQYVYGIDMAKINFRLRREQLKPTLQVKYNAINTAKTPNLFENYSINNYTWGASVYYPIFVRKARGKLRLAEVKLQDQELKTTDKLANVRYKIVKSHNSWSSLINQVAIQTENAENYQSLFQGELQLFNTGESSLFLVNTRDNERVNALVDLAEIFLELKISEIDYRYQTLSW